MFRSTFKIGKKFCFPDVPSSWIPRTVQSIQNNQDYFRSKNQIIFPSAPYIGRESRSTLHDYDNNGDNATNDGFLWCHENSDELNQFLLTNTMKTNNNNEVSFDKGETFDVISLLSGDDSKGGGYLVKNNGGKVEVDSLRGKNIVVCCFWVPCFWLSHTCNAIRELISVCSKLNAESGGKYEMVMVAKMRRNWVNDEDAFNHFFSGFPSSWLAVPFSDTLLRDHVCTSIGLDYDDPKCLLVDHNQRVIAHESITLDGGFLASPPFETDYSICNRFPYWWKTHTQLRSLLNSDFVFELNNNPETEVISGNKVSVSELKDKIVGLYLCCDGLLIRKLDLVSRECNARNKEFHIVMVYLPYKESVDPMSFQKAINHVLHNLGISSSTSNWWVSPFNDFASRMLWKHSSNHYRYGSDDLLVVLDPNMNIADPLANEVINKFGVNAYPFTRESLVQRELNALRSITLKSLLGCGGSWDSVLRINTNNNNDDFGDPDVVPIAELGRGGKIVLVYMDPLGASVWHRRSYTDAKLLQWYITLSQTIGVDNFEVVCPFDTQHTICVMKKLLKRATCDDDEPCMIAAFDKEGHIITLDAIDLLELYGPKGFSSYDGLRNEVVAYIDRTHEIFMLDMNDDNL